MRHAWVTLMMMAACGGPDPEPESTVERGVEPRPAGTAGWDGVLVDQAYALREFSLGPDDTWVPRLVTFPASDATWTAVDPDGQRVPLLLDAPEGGTRLERVVSEEPLAPGPWELWADLPERGGEERLTRFIVSDHGQDPTFDAAGLDGAVFRLEQIVDPIGVAPTLLDLTGDLYFQVQDPTGQAPTLVVWFEGRTVPLCRGWRVPANVDARGRLTVTVQDVESESGIPLEVEDLRILAGFEGPAQRVAGVEVDATLTAASLVPLVLDADGTEDQLCSRMREHGGQCVPCARSAGQCVRMELFAGAGPDVDELALLQDLGATNLGWTDLDDAPACLGPQVGEGDIDITCSALGSAAVGGWLAVMGLLLVATRRRRSDATP